MHGIRPQGHSYAQVTLLSYDMFYVFHAVYDSYVQVTARHDMFYVSMRLLFMYTFLTMLLFMSYILSTLFVLTPLLRGLRFMPRRYSQMDSSQHRRCSSEVGELHLAWSVAESEYMCHDLRVQLETLQTESWVWESVCTMIQVLYS